MTKITENVKIKAVEIAREYYRNNNCPVVVENVLGDPQIMITEEGKEYIY